MSDILDTSGFYKLENDDLLYAQNFVESFDYQLNRESRNDYIYPIHGWNWFDSEQEAKTFYNI